MVRRLLATMKPGKIIPRLVEARLQEALGDSPVVLIHGPRQCGKTTLTQRMGRKLAGIEVKAASTVTAADFRGLRKLAGAAGKRFTVGVVLYDGETSAGFGDNLYAVPIRALWEKAA